MIALDAMPIEPARYARFGGVVCAGDPARVRSANHGTAEAWDALATMESTRGPEAKLSLSLFRCAPHPGRTLHVHHLERHARSTQLFAPMTAGRYLVVVALGGVRPELDTLAAFVVRGAQAITYAPGVWHHPMVALDAPIDFVNALFVDGTDEDCDEVSWASAVASVSIAV